MKAARQKLSTNDAIMEKALKLFRGGYRWGIIRDGFPTLEQFESIKKTLVSAANRISNTRESYAEAYGAYQDSLSQFNAQYKSLLVAAESAAPGSTSTLSPTAFWDFARREATLSVIHSINEYLPDPGKMDDFTYGVDDRIKKYEVELKAYWKPLLDALERVSNGDGPDVKELEELTRKLRQQGLSWLRSGESVWNKRGHEIKEEANKIYNQAVSEKRAKKNSPIVNAYADFNRAFSHIEAIYYEQRRLRSLINNLNRLRNKGKETLLSDNERDIQSVILHLRDVTRKDGEAVLRADSNSQVANLVEEIRTIIDKLRHRISQLHLEKNQKVRAEVQLFYEKFRNAYSNRDVIGVISFLSDDWETSDGSTISDVEEILENSFRMFDEVQYHISNLNVSEMSNDNYQVSYHSSIIGKIYRMNIEHKEENDVIEVIGPVNGKMKILRTLNGRYWMR